MMMITGRESDGECKELESSNLMQGINNQLEILELSEDLLIEILVKLPVKSLVRFKCVSKRWNVLIKDPDFISAHLNNTNNNNPESTSLLVLNNNLQDERVFSFYSNIDPPPLDNVSVPVPDFDFNFSWQMVIVGQCNGLLCLLECFEGGAVILCNPMLREYRLLPPCFPRSGRYFSLISSDFGFGYDPCTNDYKIVHVFQMWPEHYDEHGDYIEEEDREDDGYEQDIKVEIYNLSTNSWRRIEATVPPVCALPYFDLFLNGVCHMPLDGAILGFHVSTEVFTTIDYPESIDCIVDCFLVLNECLAIVHYEQWMKEPKLIDIWVMKEYGVADSWSKQYTIGPILVKTALSIWKNNLLIIQGLNDQLLSCDIDDDDDTSCSTEIKELGIYSWRALAYKESLVSVYMAGGSI